MFSKIPQFSKALTAAITAGGAAFVTANVDHVIDRDEWITVAVAFVLAGLAVYNVPNAETAAAPAPPKEPTA